MLPANSCRTIGGRSVRRVFLTQTEECAASGSSEHMVARHSEQRPNTGKQYPAGEIAVRGVNSIITKVSSNPKSLQLVHWSRSGNSSLVIGC